MSEPTGTGSSSAGERDERGYTGARRSVIPRWGDTLNLTTIETMEAFAGIGDEWDALLSASELYDPFLSSAWILAWWDAYAGPDDVPRIVCARDESTGKLKGALPCFVTRDSGTRSRRLRLLSDHTLAVARPGHIAEPRSSCVIASGLAAYLADRRADWDVLDFRRVDDSSPLLTAIPGHLGDSGPEPRPDTSQHGPADLPDDWEAYLGTFSHSTRRGVRRKRRAVEGLGECVVERVERHEDLATALADCFRLFESSMERRFAQPIAISARYQEFLKRITETFWQAGRLRLYFLSIDGQRVAFAYDIRFGPTMYALKMGFDSAWASHRVGSVLNGFALQRAIEEGCRQYDFGPGRGEHKTCWGATETRPLAGLLLYGSTPAARTSAVLQGTSELTRRVARRVVPTAMRRRISALQELQELAEL